MDEKEAPEGLLQHLPGAAYRARPVAAWEFEYLAAPVRTLTGHAADDLCAGAPPFMDLLHPQDRERVTAVRRDSCDGAAAFDVTYRIRTRDGSERFVREQGKLAVGEGGVASIHGFLSDVTDQVQRERALLQAQKLEALGRLAGGIAHDINNYLAAIRSQCELVQRKHPEAARLDQKMASVVRTVEKAAALIDRLLAFSKRQPTHPQLISLNDVVAGLEPMLRRLLREDVRLDLELAQDLAPVEIDPAQVEQVLVNLVVNARDAMPRGGVIAIATGNLAPDSVSLEVRDTGLGVAPEVRDRIFEPFFTTREGEGGTGLGLATVYGIATQNGGSVAVESEMGRGASFRVLLPRATRAEAARLQAPPPSDEAPRGGGERLLVVEDHADVRASTVEVLASLGYTVTACRTAEQALVAFRASPDAFDLVVSDVVLARTSGPEMLEEMRTVRPIRAVFVSGYTESVLLARGVRRGDANYLPKPFSLAALARKVREALASP